NTAWTVDDSPGLVVFRLIFLAAPWRAGLLQVPQPTDMLRILGLPQPIHGLRNTVPYLPRRNLAFGHGCILHATQPAAHTVVGAALGPTSLAFYRMGYQISTEGSSALQLVLTPVAFPAMSRVQSDLERVRAGFRAMLGLSVVAILPLTGALILFAPLAVPL